MNYDSKERHTLQPFREKLPGNLSTSGKVGIKISSEYARTREGQMLLWMVCNLTVRLKTVMKRIELVIPRDILISKPSFIPFANSDDNFLHDAISNYSKVCSRDCEVITSDSSDFEQENDALILLGNGTETNAKSNFFLRAISDGWLAYVGKDYWHPRILLKNSSNPFGAFSAACIAVGDVFKFIGGMNTAHGSYASKLCFSSYDFSINEIENNESISLMNPELPQHIDIGKLQIVGAGAVAHSACHCLYSMVDVQAELVIIDRKTNESGGSEVIDETNLNRYIMASNKDTSRPKGNLLAEIMNHKKPLISAVGFDESFEVYVNTNTDTYNHVLSCIDTNRARHSIQDQLPKVIHGGSTFEMRTQTSFYDLAKNTQCLKCYNPISSDSESDLEVIARLKRLKTDEIEKEVANSGISPQQLIAYLNNPQCGMLGNESIQKFTKIKSEPQASVSFVSAMSGFMLAAELIKFKLQSSGFRPALNCDPNTEFVFNFWNDNGYVRPTNPNENCWCNLGITSPRIIYSSYWKSN